MIEAFVEKVVLTPNVKEPEQKVMKTLNMAKCVEPIIVSADNQAAPAQSSRAKLTHEEIVTLEMNPYEDFINNTSHTPSHVPNRIQLNATAVISNNTENDELTKNIDFTDNYNTVGASNTSSYLLKPVMIESEDPDSVYDAPGHKNFGLVITSPLREKEKILESSHRALKEKLARVRAEIEQLSEMPSSDFEGQSSILVTNHDVRSNFSVETR